MAHVRWRCQSGESTLSWADTTLVRYSLKTLRAEREGHLLDVVRDGSRKTFRDHWWSDRLPRWAGWLR